ncbi:MAG: hypothetical protein CSB47_09455 [Proteobacteria bacterium]|nr:MAG: hypothetical protein CSB47_09455 [Pseudomonadota bacterium]
MFKKILVPIDLASLDPATASLKVVKSMVEDMDAEVHILNVAPGYGTPLVASYIPQDVRKTLNKNIREELTKLAAEYLDTTPSVSIVTGKRAEKIIHFAEQWQADLIVIGCRAKVARGSRHLLGSCSSQVADRAKCNVLVVR